MIHRLNRLKLGSREFCAGHERTFKWHLESTLPSIRFENVKSPGFSRVAIPTIEFYARIPKMDRQKVGSQNKVLRTANEVLG